MSRGVDYIEAYDEEIEMITDIAEELDTSEAHVILMMRNMAIDKIMEGWDGEIPMPNDEWYRRWKEQM